MSASVRGCSAGTPPSGIAMTEFRRSRRGPNCRTTNSTQQSFWCASRAVVLHTPVDPSSHACTSGPPWHLRTRQLRSRLTVVYVCVGACCCKPCPWQGFTKADFGLKLGCDKHWADMSKQEQRAVVELGWNSRSWDAGEDHAHNQQLLTRKSTSLAIYLHLQLGTNRRLKRAASADIISPVQFVYCCLAC